MVRDWRTRIARGNDGVNACVVIKMDSGESIFFALKRKTCKNGANSFYIR